MMEVKAVIRPNKLAALRTALLDTPGFPGMTVSKVGASISMASLMPVSSEMNGGIGSPGFTSV